jgi:phage terminase large subunit
VTITQPFSAVYRDLFTTQARYILLWGGRGRGGSFTATQYFLHLLTNPDYFRGYLMREIHSDVRESLWRDLKDRIEENEDLDERYFDLNESQMAALYPATGNTILSKGFKKSAGNRTAKLKSLAGATHVLIEEAEEISEADFLQLDDSLRTTKSKVQIVMIFNPPSKSHWIWKRWFTLIDAPGNTGYFQAIPRTTPELLSIFSTYPDNEENINPSTVTQWESYRDTNPDHYWTIIRGLISEGARGRIYKTWTPCVKMPALYSKWYCLDWGFSNDPLALVELEAHNRQLWVQEKLYQTGLTNDDLERELIRLKVPKVGPIYADSAQPKDIEDMRRRGWNFIGAVKGTGSVKSGIKFIQQYEVFLTEDSKNLWKEVENYAWALDHQKNPTDEPIDAWNHGLDAINYGMDKLRRSGGLVVVKPEGSGQRVAANGRSNYNM